MRILYGVVGEGMGHATRSRVLLDELSKHHEIHIVVSGRAQQYLEKRFQNVHGIWGLTIAYEGNQVKTWQTVLQLGSEPWSLTFLDGQNVLASEGGQLEWTGS